MRHIRRHRHRWILAAVLMAAGCSPGTSRPPQGELDIAHAVLEAPYSLDHLGAGTVRLSGGVYEDSASGVESHLIASAAGDLDGDARADAAVVLATQAGGTGTFVDLYAVLERGGRTRTHGPASLGDRVKVDSLAVRDGAIVLHLVTHGPDDALCCPTLKTVARYVLEADSLVARREPLP